MKYTKDEAAQCARATSQIAFGEALKWTKDKGMQKMYTCDGIDWLYIAAMIEADQVDDAYNHWRMMDTAAREMIADTTYDFFNQAVSMRETS